MADTFSREKRRSIMQSVRRTGTAAELRFASILRELGLPYKCQANLTGKPDFFFPKQRVAVFIHGCFWHGHSCRKGAQTPKTNAKYWRAKIARNAARDHRVARVLRKSGYSVYTVYECTLRIGKYPKRLLTRLQTKH